MKKVTRSVMALVIATCLSTVAWATNPPSGSIGLVGGSPSDTIAGLKRDEGARDSLLLPVMWESGTPAGLFFSDPVVYCRESAHPLRASLQRGSAPIGPDGIPVEILLEALEQFPPRCDAATISFGLPPGWRGQAIGDEIILFAEDRSADSHNQDVFLLGPRNSSFQLRNLRATPSIANEVEPGDSINPRVVLGTSTRFTILFPGELQLPVHLSFDLTEIDREQDPTSMRPEVSSEPIALLGDTSESPSQDLDMLAPGDNCWDSRFFASGADDTVRASAWDGANLYIAGSFTTVGTIPAQRIAKWNGSTWLPLGSGMDWTVSALLWDGTNLYAGGGFTTAGGVSAKYIAKWNGTTWSPLGSGMNGTVSALAWDGTNLYAGGMFTAAGGVSANYIAKWNGTAWSALGTGTNDRVISLVWGGTNLYAGGAFTSAGGVTAYEIAKWNGTSWGALGSGLGTYVVALAWDGTNLYAGGNFGGYLRKWNGTTWSSLGTLDQQPTALAWDGADLYVGGVFTMAGGVSASRIAKWNGTTFSALGAGVTGPGPVVNTITKAGPDLYAGGNFTTAGGVAAVNVAKWDGAAWQGTVVGSGQGILGSSVNSLLRVGSDIYAGGSFQIAGSASSAGIAKWNGTTWDSVGAGVGEVNALEWDGANLYAGGWFVSGGSPPANYIAKWDGATLSPLGTGMNAVVGELAWDGNNLYAAGAFTTAGGVPANYIAKWNGTTWNSLGTGMNGQVNGIVWTGTNLYAGGQFTTAGGVTVNRIAKWDGSSWSPLGTGMNGIVYSVGWDGTNLYASGNFTFAGGVAANHIAKWNGTTWSPLGSGLNTYAFALDSDGTNIYAGGWFTTAGGVPANYIAKWNGTTWSPFGPGTNGNVLSLAHDESGVYVGGDFTAVGPTVSSYIARWTTSAAISSSPADRVACQGNATAFFVNSTGGGPLAYQWQVDEGSGFSDLSDSTPYSGANTPNLILSSVTSDMSGFAYRCVVNGSCGGPVTSLPATLTVGAPQPEVATLSWTDDLTLSWSPSAATYTVYRGSAIDLPALLTSGPDSCTRYVGTATSATIDDDPTGASGGLFWYIVSGTSAAGCEGTAGYSTIGDRVVNSSGACP